MKKASIQEGGRLGMKLIIFFRSCRYPTEETFPAEEKKRTQRRLMADQIEGLAPEGTSKKLKWEAKEYFQRGRERACSWVYQESAKEKKLIKKKGEKDTLISLFRENRSLLWMVKRSQKVLNPWRAEREKVQNGED